MFFRLMSYVYIHLWNYNQYYDCLFNRVLAGGRAFLFAVFPHYFIQGIHFVCFMFFFCFCSIFYCILRCHVHKYIVYKWFCSKKSWQKFDWNYFFSNDFNVNLRSMDQNKFPVVHPVLWFSSQKPNYVCKITK